MFENAGIYKIIDEASPKYLYLKVATREIYKFNPNPKIIIKLRQPISFLRSKHLQSLICFNDDVKNFQKDINDKNYLLKIS